MKIAVAMSGGIDSSVAAALLKQQGHDVIGVTMKLADNANSQNAITGALKVAEKLGIPHHVIDLQSIFQRVIINDFCREYGLGRTPNPCVLCNRHIKFGVLWEKARGLGANFLATGHYARIEKTKSGEYLLKKGKDKAKDQSYFLCQLTQEQLGRSLLSIGDLTKAKVRKIAQEMELPVAVRNESQEICFVADNDHARFLKEYYRGAIETGPILDLKGHKLGEHQGIMFYTIGQRKGLGITAAEPLYVIAIEPEKNAVIVGLKKQTYARELIADSINWITESVPEKPTKVKTRIRHRHPEAESTVSSIKEDIVHVKFNKPQMAITPGQAVVFYKGDTVIGGGRIIRQGK
jgi:tRNA-specific 2-thiouridylase